VNFSETFIHRPIATSLLMAGVALFGVIAYNNLSVSDLPQVDYPTITVSASLPGANPDTMASAVATPLERQFTTIAGLDSMISNSGQGSTNITLQFDLSRDIDGATVDVETAIAEAMTLLPPGMPTPPSFRKVNPGDTPIINLFLTSPTMRLSDLDEYAETMLAQRISMVEGVAQVQVLAPPNTPCASRWTPTNWPPARSGSMKSMPPSAIGTSTSPPARSTARTPPTTSRSTAS
jgi:HAE1 family hydrophobic/amphiphilic exporter-1